MADGAFVVESRAAARTSLVVSVREQSSGGSIVFSNNLTRPQAGWRMSVEGPDGQAIAPAHPWAKDVVGRALTDPKVVEQLSQRGIDAARMLQTFTQGQRAPTP